MKVAIRSVLATGKGVLCRVADIPMPASEGPESRLSPFIQTPRPKTSFRTGRGPARRG